MRIYHLCCVAVMAAVTLTITAPSVSAYDESIQPVVREVSQASATSLSFDDQMRQFESRLSMLESQPLQTSCNSCPIPSQRIATNSLRNAWNYAGFELAVLKAYTGSISGAVPLLGLAGSLTPEFDYEASPRIYLGRERCDGLGIRATYWQFDHSTDTNALGVAAGLEVHALDLEVTSRREFCGSDTLISAGLRYGYLESGISVAALGGDILNFQSEGVGPTIGASMRRDLGQTQWNLVIGGRASLLLTDASVSIPTIITVNATDSTMQVFEGRFALERKLQLRNNAELVTQFGFEAQNWQSGAIAGLINPNFALAGPTFRIGMNY